MYESRHQPVLSNAKFARRLANHVAVALFLVLASVAIGMCGYVFFEDLEWIDAFLNATMLLGGMGPVDPPHTTGGKLFAGFFALYAGLIFLATAALVFTPLLHRVMHSFHWSEKVE